MNKSRLIRTVIAVTIVIVIASLYFWIRTYGVSVAVLHLTSDPYSALYDCAESISKANPFPANILEERFLERDLFFVLNRYTNDIYIYTPSFAGHDQLISGDTVNFRIPHDSTQGVGKGYFYATAHDQPFENHHDTRINLPPRFVAGDPVSLPDFSKVPSHDGVTLLASNYATTTQPFMALSIEKDIWSVHTQDIGAVNALITLIIGKLPDLYRTTHMGCPGLGCRNSTFLDDSTFNNVIVACKNAAGRTGNKSLENALSAIQK